MTAPVPGAPRLWCARLSLAEFRNHAALELALDARPVCLFGPNGAGKTNILEALTTLAPGRGLRGADLPDLARGGLDGAAGRLRAWSVGAELVLDGQALQLGAGAERGPDGRLKRLARLDGRPATAGELARAARMSWITPAMDRLFVGPAGDRRRFLDRMVLAQSPQHGAHAAAYERALRARARLLEEGGRDEDWLAGLEREMARHGVAVAAARARLLAALHVAIATRPEGAFPRAAIALDGPLEMAAAEGGDTAALEARFAADLKAGRRRDAAAGRTLVGPHRSDLVVHHAGKAMPAAQCSTGEQKALLIGMVLAHARAVAEDPAAGPALVLIDEAAAHLDPDRRAALAEELLALPGQAWLTGTDAALFAAFGPRAQLIAVG